MAPRAQPPHWQQRSRHPMLPPEAAPLSRGPNQTGRAMSENQLGAETSPYLLQHQDNPVHWRPWGPDALAEAKADDKPILLSVGYSACHWCHVMAHESFEDEETARLMNRLFVNIKVDREERPDLDTIYQRALALMGQQGGWPLTMFLTPEAEPFWGGTYFPLEPRFGRPGFKDVLSLIEQTYRNDREKVDKNRTTLVEALQGLARSTPGEAVTETQTENMARSLLREVDGRHGGIGGAPKFPQCSMLELLWRSYLRTGSQLMKTAVVLSMERMCQGGIYDHLGGGFARYSTDERWLAPHFEKMLYDNAQLLDLLCHVWRETGEPLFAARAAETVAWVLREMRTGEGAFASALDADSEGEEGKFYVWHEAEIDELLGADAAYFMAVYDVTPGGNWEGKTILNRLLPSGIDGTPDEARLAKMRTILLERRAGRERPGWDDKVLADWNGLMIAALANAAMVFGEQAWLDAAREAFEYVAGPMAAGERLRHAARHGRSKDIEFLDDYAEMARAALMLAEATGEASYVEKAGAWVAVLDAHYWDADEGGYFYAPDDGEASISRTKTAHDAATPAGNGTMVGVLARLHHLTGETAYRDRAEALVKAFSGELERNFSPLSTLANNSEVLRRAVQVVVCGARTDEGTKALLDAVYATSLPDRVLTVLEPSATLPLGHPAFGKGQQEGQATAYVCVGPVCSLPVTEADVLRAALDNARAPAEG